MPTRSCCPATGSVVADVTVAVSDSVTPWPGAVTVTVIDGAEVPVASVGRVHVTDTFPVFEHVHPVPVADTNVTPAGQRVRHRHRRRIRRTGVGDRERVGDAAPCGHRRRARSS